MEWDFSYWNNFTTSQKINFLLQNDDAVISGYEWGKTTITYSFPTSSLGLEYSPYIPAGEYLNYTPMNAVEAQFIRYFLAYLETFLALDFQEVSGPNGDLAFGKHNMTPGGYANYPSALNSQIGVFLSDEAITQQYGDWGFGTIVHEIGHALGLSHTRSYDGQDHPNAQLPLSFDTTFLSVMSYTDTARFDPFKQVASFRDLDISALFQMYGQRASTQSTTFKIEDGFVMPSVAGNVVTVSGDVPFTVVDTGGYDTIDASAYAVTAASDVRFDFSRGLWLTAANPFHRASLYGSGQWTDISGKTDNIPAIGIYVSTVIEQYIGTAASDSVYGNNLAQTAATGAGADLFYGRGGNDVFNGGAGDDTAGFTGVVSGYQFVLDTLTSAIVVTDLNASDGDEGVDRLIGVEFANFSNQSHVAISTLLVSPTVPWEDQTDDVMTVAATWQLTMGYIPLEPGFEYLISSDSNPNDLNDGYYSTFNTENRYLNFLCNLAFETVNSAEWFEAEYGALNFAQAVNKAVNTIITASGSSDLAASKAFFLNSQSYFQQVALERIVRPGVDLAEATKAAMLSSVLYEAVKADAGPYGEAVHDFAAAVAGTGVSPFFGESLFTAV